MRDVFIIAVNTLRFGKYLDTSVKDLAQQTVLGSLKEAGIDKKFMEAPQFYGFYSLMILAGAGLILYPDLPLITIMYVSQVINGMVLPFVLIFMLLLINDKKIMGEHTNGPVLNVIAWVTSGVMIGLTLLLLIRSF